jgi:ubiquinone/menaquinone biosynthesis C-methylase UbiE
MSLSNEVVKKYYDDKSPAYDDYSRQLWSKVYDAVTWKITEPYVPRNPQALVFDAAGGTGKWTIPIAKCGPRVILGDISEGMLRVAKGKIIKEGLQGRVEVKECDLRKLDFQDETFDLVFCEHALCFIKEQEKVIGELVRVLKKGHPIIVTGQNRYVMSISLVSEDANYAYSVLSKEKPFFMRNSLNVYTLSPDELQVMLDSNGVRIEKIVGKLFTMPLGLSGQSMIAEDYTKEFLERMTKMELELSGKPDSVCLGSHLQAIGFKIDRLQSEVVCAEDCLP